uniref:Uncharacterized protein n=1 Tax=Dunaliella tertiolecta TaxID=3047 RepID=A0A7S3VIX8_DUNTE|eukprot:scaffold208715_cov17-Tisochrysis_lutea.AAC.1
MVPYQNTTTMWKATAGMRERMRSSSIANAWPPCFNTLEAFTPDPDRAPLHSKHAGKDGVKQHRERMTTMLDAFIQDSDRAPLHGVSVKQKHCEVLSKLWQVDTAARCVLCIPGGPRTGKWTTLCGAIMLSKG